MKTTTQQQQRIEAAREAQRKLNAAFRALRSQGIICRQRFWCCNSCASYAAAAEVKENDAKGVVFYCKQAGFIVDGNARRLYLHFGGKSYDTSLPDKKVGKLVVEALRDAGLHVEWDGRRTNAILVDPCPTLWDKKAA